MGFVGIGMFMGRVSDKRVVVDVEVNGIEDGEGEIVE